MEKLGNSARKAMGRGKKKAGEVTDNPKLKAEGRMDEASGSAGQATEQIKDVGKGALGD